MLTVHIMVVRHLRRASRCGRVPVIQRSELLKLKHCDFAEVLDQVVRVLYRCRSVLVPANEQQWATDHDKQDD